MRRTLLGSGRKRQQFRTKSLTHTRGPTTWNGTQHAIVHLPGPQNASGWLQAGSGCPSQSYSLISAGGAVQPYSVIRGIKWGAPGVPVFTWPYTTTNTRKNTQMFSNHHVLHLHADVKYRNAMCQVFWGIAHQKQHRDMAMLTRMYMANSMKILWTL